MMYDIDPRGHFVYSLWGVSEKRPFYVGMTSSLLSRLGSHARNRTVKRRLRRVLVQRVESREAAVELERELIQKYRPPYNIRDNSVKGKLLERPKQRPLEGPSRKSAAPTSWRQRAALAAAEVEDDEDDDDFEFLPGWCPLCGTHHRPDPCENERKTP